MKSLMLLWKEVLTEVGTWCHTSTIRDLKTASDRFEHEGQSFLTITLPSYCSDFQKSLDQGYVSHDQFPGFSRTGGLPRFLGGFLDLVFDRASGRLLNNASLDAIKAIRQLTLMYGKILLPCSDAREKDAIEAYVECENEVRMADANRDTDSVSDYKRVSQLCFAQLFSDWDLSVYNGELLPKHGPGSTADKLSGNEKWSQQEWTDRLESVLPMGEYLLPSWRYWQELERIELVEPGAERPVRVITVPKTLKTPRIIAIEPTCMQYMQQAMLKRFMELHNRDNLLYALIGFDDQLPNQELARLGSLTGSLATLDLSEASDRVSNQLVRALFANHPHLAEAVDATRSRKADVPGHGVLRLAKFASMGSALCFPVEAMVFLTVVLIGIEKELKRPLTRKDVESLKGRVRVYGDDIIVPVEYVLSVVNSLQNFGFKVNTAKSYWNGSFRESCGGDFYNGHNVNVVRVRRKLPMQRQNVDEIVSSVSLRNQLYEAGFRDTCDWIDKRMAKVLRYFPRVTSTSSVLGRHDDSGFDRDRHSDKPQKPLVKGYVVSSRLPVNRLDGPSALLKWYLTKGFEPLSIDHLERSGRPESVDIKLRWASPV